MEIVKVTGNKENCQLLGYLPFDIDKLSETEENGMYSVYYQIHPEDNYQSIDTILNAFENKKATNETIKQSVKSQKWFALPLKQITKLLGLRITGASVLEPWCCPWDGEWEPPALYYFKCDNGNYELLDDIDDVLIQTMAANLFDTYNIVDEDGEYFIP